MNPSIDQIPFCQVDDAGVQLVIQFIDEVTLLPIDISLASAMIIKVEYPDQTTADFTASFVTNGADGLIGYITQGTDLAQAGTYIIQGKVTLPGGGRSSRRAQFNVYNNVDDN